ncbi:MAG TPA: hypothetical protein VK552_18715 [Reyranella sp.]|nr:hypothetical protein [Reyranella sp.]
MLYFDTSFLTPLVRQEATSDTLHLAIGANRRMDTIFSLDKMFLKAGNMLGLPVSRGV